MKVKDELYRYYYWAWMGLKRETPDEVKAEGYPSSNGFGAYSWVAFFTGIHDGRIQTEFARKLKAKVVELRLTG